MDLSKLGRTEQVLAAAGILLFIFSFLPWYSISYLGMSWHASAWSDPSGFLDWFPVLLLTVYGVVLALPAFGVVLNAPLLADAKNRAFIGLALSAVAVLFFAIQGLTYPSADGLGGPAWAYYVSLVLALAAGVQSYLGFTQQGGSLAAVSASVKARTQAAQAGQQQPGAAPYGGVPQQQPQFQQQPEDPQQQTPPPPSFGS
ncbi:MAG TPA: hypothetical protein VL551_25980 [Actinospica sp.]|jgi:hypothetical protein|nr:hypothetical protein [Actinospica sp.]